MICIKREIYRLNEIIEYVYKKRRVKNHGARVNASGMPR